MQARRLSLNVEVLTIMAKKLTSDEARQQVEMAEKELIPARRIRQQAWDEFKKARTLHTTTTRQINVILL